MAFGLMKRISPEYVLKNAITDMRTAGLDGLKPYLTANALKKIESVQSISGGIGMVAMGLGLAAPQGSAGDSASALLFMLNNLSKIDWTVQDVLKGSSSSKGVVGFRYEDSIKGTIELTLIKESKEWRIDNLSMPKFEKLSLPG